MKKKIQNIFIILFSTLFFVLSSGVFITLHEHCHKHQHAKNDHRHCHETKLFVKIEEDFIKSKPAQISIPVAETVLFFTVQTHPVFETTTPYFQHTIPPLIKLAGVNFINFTSQRVFYA